MENQKKLTVHQAAVYQGILNYQEKHGYAPLIRELCNICGLASTSSVYNHLKALEKKGYIRRKEDTPRAIAVM